MNSLVCVNCSNEKPVNQTSNRLVTESCGHVKCMDCLLEEKSGCVACLRNKDRADFEEIDDDVCVLTHCTVAITDPEALDNDSDEPDDDEIKKKPETTHITIKTDANGSCYTCTICGGKFHARSMVAYHAYCNPKQKMPYDCHECNKTFRTHSHYKYHMRVHRNERIYPCDVCGDSFFQMSKLQRHKLKHTKEKKFACQQCNKAFNNLTALRKHGLTHTQEKPHGCKFDFCRQRFRDKSNLKKHEAKHAGSESTTTSRTGHERRAFQCPRCPQAFRSKKDMRRHSAVHSDSKPFRCKVCDRRFRRKDNLERHIRNTHPDHVTSSAIEFDERALTDQPVPPTDNGAASNEVVHEDDEKTRLEILNPLPPLGPDVIQRHLRSSEAEKPVIAITAFIEKSYILEANNARESVICVNRKKSSTTVKKQEWSDGNEYVHKIKKPTYWARDKDISLPPVDAGTFSEFLVRKDEISNDVVVPPKNTEIYKKFFLDDKKINPERANGRDVQENEIKSSTSAEVHWRKKKLNIS